MSVLRFAPSPNGELHLGHAFSALLNADIARRTGGRLLLRIEDIDIARCTPEFEAGIYRDLEWLGIEWEQPVRRQSQHFEDYAKALDRLIRNDLVYPAFMSRSEIRAHIAAVEDRGRAWPRDPDGVPHYPAIDKTLSVSNRKNRIAAGEAFSWRLDMVQALESMAAPLAWEEFALADGATSTPTPNPSPQGGGGHGSADAKSPSPLWGGVRGGGHKDRNANSTAIITADPSRWGDVILARKDTPTSYNLSVVLDDALQGVRHVVRGQDLYEATSVHRLLQQLLGLPAPIYHHHRLILGSDGRKLSKSEKSTGLRALREAGQTPDQIKAMLGFGKAA